MFQKEEQRAGDETYCWHLFIFSVLLPDLCRELLTDHRVPGLLLEAMKVAVRKQRKKIKAKMLGTPEEAESR